MTLEARAAPPSGAESEQLQRGVSLPDAEQLVAPLFRLRVPTEDAANDVTYYDA